jgi:outer membrane lipoprotein-sorting protein
MSDTMSDRGPAIFIAAVLSFWLAGSAALQAQDVPMPKPAPAPKDRSAPAPTAPQPTNTSPAPAASDPLGSFLNAIKPLNPFGKPATDPSAFDEKQRRLVARVSTYLTGVQNVSGNFVQVGPDGRRTTGHMYIQKPGRVRFEYDPPTPIEIVADGSQVVVRDRKLGQDNLYPLSQTPLRFLLADKIDLMQDTHVVGVTADDTFVTVTVEETQPLVGTSRLMMMFDSKDFKLKQWTITDIQGLDTTVALSSLDTMKNPDPNLFKIDYTRAMQ